MRFIADEGVDATIVARLRAEGHDILYVADLAPGISDEAVLEIANAEGRLLLTNDRDFGELMFRLRRATSGVFLLRLSSLFSEGKAHHVAQAIREHGHQMMGAFTVISPGLVRIRPPL